MKLIFVLGFAFFAVIADASYYNKSYFIHYQKDFEKMAGEVGNFTEILTQNGQAHLTGQLKHLQAAMQAYADNLAAQIADPKNQFEDFAPVAVIRTDAVEFEHMFTALKQLVQNAQTTSPLISRAYELIRRAEFVRRHSDPANKASKLVDLEAQDIEKLINKLAHEKKINLSELGRIDQQLELHSTTLISLIPKALVRLMEDTIAKATIALETCAELKQYSTSIKSQTEGLKQELGLFGGEKICSFNYLIQLKTPTDEMVRKVESKILLLLDMVNFGKCSSVI